MRISILCPTWGRPSGAWELAESALAMAADSRRVEIWFYVDFDDPKMVQYLEQLHLGPSLHVLVGEPISVSKSWTILAEHCSGDVLVLGNDDVLYRTPGWDDILEEELQAFPDDIYCAWFDDMINGSKLCAFPMVSRKWFETLGYFTPGTFEFIYNAAWIADIAEQLGRLHYIPRVVTEHLHFSTGKSELDETYQRNRQGQVQRDREVFLSTADMRRRDAEKLRKLICENPIHIKPPHTYLLDPQRNPPLRTA